MDVRYARDMLISLERVGLNLLADYLPMKYLTKFGQHFTIVSVLSFQVSTSLEELQKMCEKENAGCTINLVS